VQPVLAREIQRDVFTGEPTHVDFLAVSMTEKITAEVAISLVGEPTAFSEVDAMLLQGINTLQIECLPGDLIPSLEVDVSDLQVDGALYVGDLVLPDNITVLSDPQEMLAQVVRERLEEEEEEEEEELLVDGAPEIEVITRGRTEDDTEE
jgi:large subunit ribosomal protein L25